MQQQYQLQNAYCNTSDDLVRRIKFVPTMGHILWQKKEENTLVERMNKEINRHLRALPFENSSLDNYAESLPFVQRILNANYSDRLKVSSAQLLFGNVINLDRGIF